MSRAIRAGDWPEHLSDEEIITGVGQRAYARGRDYALRGRVRDLAIAGQGELISAEVQGSGRRAYQTLIVRGAEGGWVGSCSCPVGVNCKHSAAVLLTARALAEDEDSGQDPDGSAGRVPRRSPRPSPSWELQLSRILRQERRSAGRRMALEITDEHSTGWSSWGGDEGLSMTPLIEGKRGWKRQGASWERVCSGALDDEADAAALGALRELASLAPESLFYSSARIPLADSPAWVWEGLGRAVEAGITLTTAQKGGAAVRIVPGLQAGVAMHHQGGDGTQLIISPIVKHVEVEELMALPEGLLPDLLAVGEPVHGYYAWMPTGELLLLPLDPPPGPALAEMLAHSESIVVPSGDLERFEAEHLEAVSRALPVLVNETAVELPDPAQPVLVLGVRVDPEGHRMTTGWQVRYRTSSGQERGRHEAGSLGDLASAWTGGRSGPGGPGRAGAARDTSAEASLARQAAGALAPLAPGHGDLTRPLSLSGMDTARFITRTLPLLQDMPGFEVEVGGDVPDYRESEHAPLITTEVADDDDRPDWFSLRIRVRVGQEEIPIPRVMAALAAGQEEVLLDSGAWVSLDRPEIHTLARLMEEGRELEDSPGSLRVTSLQAGYYEELEALGVVSRASLRWKERVGRLLERTEAAEAAGGAGGAEGLPAPEGMRAELRPYQLEGYRWLDMLRSAGLGGVLADDMGLGKTVQVLAAIQRMIEAAGARGPEPQALGPGQGSIADQGAETPPGAPGQPRESGDGAADPAVGAGAQARAVGEGADEQGTRAVQPVLVIAPTSVVGSWVEQAERFCPTLRVRAVTRTAAKREEPLPAIVAQADLVVTSYTIARLCEEEFTEQEWDWVVCDEAQFVKNHTSATYKAVRRLRAPSTVAITGTPLENSLMDLWSLLSIAAPGLLPGPERFGQVYRRPIDHGDLEALARLRRRMRPFLLRRTKEQVAAELPAKTEQVLSIELDPRHRHAYDQRLARERQKILGLLEEDSAQARFSALKSLTTLRQMALDPALIEGHQPSGGPGAAKGGRSEARGRPTAKVAALLERLEPILAEGHRALVFSQFTRYLTGVREHLEARGMRTAYLDGATTDRQGVIDSFRSGQAEVFLISLKAGGFGLTLTEADYVFLLDPWWNPQTEEQAVDRTHRIGQDKPVMVYRMVSAQTIEEKVMALKEKKAELFGRVVEGSADPQERGPASASGPAALSAAEIRALIEG